jgi:hypothetical protein
MAIRLTRFRDPKTVSALADALVWEFNEPARIPESVASFNGVRDLLPVIEAALDKEKARKIEIIKAELELLASVGALPSVGHIRQIFLKTTDDDVKNSAASALEGLTFRK